MRAKFILIVGLAVVASDPSLSAFAQPGDESNGFDMNNTVRSHGSSQQPEATEEAVQENSNPAGGHPYPKYQFKSSGKNQAIIPNFIQPEGHIAYPVREPAVDNTQQQKAQPAADEESAASSGATAAAAAGDANYYKTLVNKVKSQGEAKEATTKQQSKIAEYKF